MCRIRRKLKYSNTEFIAGVFLLLLGFSGIANATLSGLPLGYPRFVANKMYIDNYKSGTPGTMYFDAYSVNNKVFWDDAPGGGKERIKKSPFFYVQADLDVSVDKYNPTVSNGLIEVWGKINSLGVNGLLFTADLKDEIYWNHKTIEYVIDGSTMDGKVCDLGYCSYSDEALVFNLRKPHNFNGNFSKSFFRTAKGIAVVPIPAAAWLFSTALLGLTSCRRKSKSV